MKIKRKRYKKLIKKYKKIFRESSDTLNVVWDELIDWEPRFGAKEELSLREARLKAQVVILYLVINDLKELEDKR